MDYLLLIIKVGPSLNAYHDIPHLFGAPPRSDASVSSPVECLLVIDSGFSHTTVTPLYRGRPIQQAIRRLDIGGKFLTNFLKELVSIRHYNMTDETHLMNEIKETVCYVSKDFAHDLEVAKGGGGTRSKKTAADGRDVVIDYVLPDYNSHKRGFMRPHDPSLATKIKKMGAMANPGGVVEDFMTLGNERFSVPELLFNPGDVGMKQAGLPETVLQSLSGLPSGLWPVMLANILVVGGNAKIDGFIERLYASKFHLFLIRNAKLNRETEIRQLAPSECTVRIATAPESVENS